MQDVRDLAGLESAIRASDEAPVVLFKHSRSCPISASAHASVAEMGAPGDPAVYRIVIQEARPVSAEVAARFKIRHESPQAILLWRGERVFDASHFDVTADALRKEAAAHAG